MKRALGFLALACILMSAVGCDGLEGGDVGGSNHFKEYTFTGTANSEQTKKIKEGLQKSLLSISSIITKEESNYKSGSSKSSGKSDSTLNILEDSANADKIIISRATNSSSDATSNGITINSTSKSEYKHWDAGKGYAFQTTKTTNNGVTEDNASYNELTGSSQEYKESVIKSLVSLPESNTYYINSDGSYTIINSSIEKNVTGVQWGNDTKEYIVGSKTQTVYSISKDYKLTKYYRYEERSSNRDQTTGEWFGSARIYYRVYTSKEYKYEKRGSASIATYNASIADKTWQISLGLSCYEATANNNLEITQESETPYSVSYSQYVDAGGVETYRLVTSITRPMNNQYYAKRFAFISTTLYGADRVVTNEYNLLTNEQTTLGSNVYNYYHIYTSGGCDYFINTSTYSYYDLEIVFTFDGANATVLSVNLY